MNVDKLFVATKAFIEHEGKVLILREAGSYDEGTNHGKYDVPGGRLIPGEYFKEALAREIKEETSLNVEIGNPIFANEWRPNVRGEQWQIVGTFFLCKATTNQVTLSKDHDQFLWIDPNEYQNYPLIENLKLAFKAYLER